MFIISKDGNIVVNLKDISYIKIEDTKIIVGLINEDIEIGEFSTEEEARSKFEEIIKDIAVYDNKKFIEIK